MKIALMMNVGVLVKEEHLVLFLPVVFVILMNATKGQHVLEMGTGVLMQVLKLLHINPISLMFVLRIWVT